MSLQKFSEPTVYIDGKIDLTDDLRQVIDNPFRDGHLASFAEIIRRFMGKTHHGGDVGHARNIERVFMISDAVVKQLRECLADDFTMHLIEESEADKKVRDAMYKAIRNAPR